MATTFCIRSCLFSSLLLLISFADSGLGSSCDMEVSSRFDCDPDNIATEVSCLARGCCWRPLSAAPRSAPLSPLNTPYCFFPSDFGGYRVTGNESTATGLLLKLTLEGKGSHYGSNIKHLAVDVSMANSDRIRVKVTDADNARYEVPIPLSTTSQASLSRNYRFTYTEYPFGFAVIRKENGQVIFNSSVSAMLYADQLLQVSSVLPSANIYGLGEHVLDFKLATDWTKLTMFARDVATPEGGFNLYGVHPFYLNVEDSGRANGVLLLNSNAMDVILQPTPAITYRTIGGVLDFHIFVGSSPADVVQNYQQLIGLPTMPPYWSLGFHLCRWGYGNLDRVKEVVSALKKNSIPQDVQWNDIDYMQDHLDFTIDEKNFGGLPEYVSDLHDQGMHYVVITDPAISNSQPKGYEPYSDGLEMDVFVKDASGKPIVGKVWPGTTVFPDFFHPNASAYWTRQIQTFHQTLEFDGLWIDMNEPSNFVAGSMSGCPNSKFETPPYMPAVLGGKLRSTTLCMTSQQHIGLHYNLHSLYGYSEGVHTMTALEKTRGRRSLVIGRSTFVGSGGHQGHWLGDNHSTWKDMANSISGILNFNLFGVPLVGADICGFIGDTTEELCARWMQLGAFYPFSRNHNDLHSRPQDPAAFGDLLLSTSRNALSTRYTLLPYLYTLFNDAHRVGSAVAQPLFFIAPTDPQALSVDSQFLWGQDLLISPVLVQGAKSVKAYFPSGTWYDFHSGEAFLSNGTYRQLGASFDKVNLHVRGGSILPWQKPALTTTVSRKNGFGLYVAPDSNGAASGHVYLDDGDSLDFSNPSKHSLIEFKASKGALLVQATVAGYQPQGKLDFAIINGVQNHPQLLLVNGHKLSSYEYDAINKKLSIFDMGLDFLETSKLTWQ